LFFRLAHRQPDDARSVAGDDVAEVVDAEIEPTDADGDDESDGGDDDRGAKPLATRHRGRSRVEIVVERDVEPSNRCPVNDGIGECGETPERENADGESNGEMSREVAVSGPPLPFAFMPRGR